MKANGEIVRAAGQVVRLPHEARRQIPTLQLEVPGIDVPHDGPAAARAAPSTAAERVPCTIDWNIVQTAIPLLARGTVVTCRSPGRGRARLHASASCSALRAQQHPRAALGDRGLCRLRPRHAAADPGLPGVLRAAGDRHPLRRDLGRHHRARLQHQRLHRRDRARRRRQRRARADRSRQVDRHDSAADPDLHPAAAGAAPDAAAADQRADQHDQEHVAAVGDLGLRADAGRAGDHLGALRAVRDLPAAGALLLCPDQDALLISRAGSRRRMPVL